MSYDMPPSFFYIFSVGCEHMASSVAMQPKQAVVTRLLRTHGI